MICSRCRNQFLIFICLYPFLMTLERLHVTKQATFMVVFLAHSSRGITFYSLALVSDNCNTKKLTAFFELFLPNPVTHPFLPRFQMSF